jgi:hypothetical protein
MGCGGGGGTPSTPPPPATGRPVQIDSKAEVKKFLEGVAESGYLGSGAAAIESQIKTVGDAGLAKDFEAIQKETDQERIKQLAKQMAGKL